ncbi:hypothetical protein H9Y04_27455 [Streptomyces sp. TRM66268-LWL]|uniref:Integral membrane protein n=1 Tax=Streptomyces polyasparticus TaxID=2767826 RepID=A0ABR7SN06_9ACTN|nr:hypothetical protein [Streptomyces polyasparticus]MBC9716279.1 hypothetical protein [Streptomyces polyasparticus]
MRSLTPLKKQVVKLSAVAVVAASLAAQVIGALLPNVPLLITAAATGLAAEAVLHLWQKDVLYAVAKTHANVTVRQVLRDFLLVAGLLSMDLRPPEAVYLPLLFGLLLFYGLHFATQAASVLVRRSRTLPVLTRNIDTSGLRLSAAPPSLLLRNPGARLLLFGLPATAGLTAAAADAAPGLAAWGVSLSVGIAAVGLGELLVRLPRRKRPADTEAALEWFENWLAEYRPTVGMYFSGGSSSAYQANMWLEPLAALEGRPLIVLRERFMMQKIGATDIPIVCLPKVADLMRLEHSTLKVLIHPANSGKTSQILRIPTIKHAFVNHGESDKLSSCNPYAKAYDEVWVAGPAARERYALADVGIEDRDIVEIGRPQLDAIKPYSGPPTGEFTTVLYAPTWEGWDGNPGNTSVVLAGENIVRELLADPGVRLLYKPHPLTGSVDPRAGAADQRMREMIRAANQARRIAPAAPSAELELRSAELAALSTNSFRSGADAMERMILQTAPEPGRSAAVAEAEARWHEAYWASLPAGEHQIITDARPTLYACFDITDVLVSDVSSVVSDYLSSGKPYAVANTSGLDEAAFRAAFPTVRAAAILPPDGTGVAALLESVRHPEKDELAPARAELKAHLLGPSDPPSVVRFNAAAQALCAEADAHRARMAARNADAIPAQRTGEDAERAQRAVEAGHAAEEQQLETLAD